MKFGILKIGDWVNVRGRDDGPGRIREISGKYFKADFLKEDADNKTGSCVECNDDKIPISDIEKIIWDSTKIEELEKEYNGMAPSLALFLPPWE